MVIAAKGEESIGALSLAVLQAPFVAKSIGAWPCHCEAVRAVPVQSGKTLVSSGFALSPVHLIVTRFADSATINGRTKKTLSERPIFPKLSLLLALYSKVER